MSQGDVPESGPTAGVVTSPEDLAASWPQTFRISPLIRFTLLLLYGVLTLPLPILARATAAPVSSGWLWFGVAIGAVGLWGVLAERVILDREGLQTTYPVWFRSIARRGWRLAWSEITALKHRTTGQGGLVYYLVGRDGQAYLLPMRLVGFARFVKIIQAQTGLDMRDVKPLAQPWMYLILLVCALLLGLVDLWTIVTAHALGSL